MSQPITWRSVTAPQFGSTAALLNAGSDSVNRGIMSLSDLAKGIADEQKGIEVSNAVAALNKAGTDAERSAIFDANAAALGARGIDLKDFTAANLARHEAIQKDAAFTSNQALNESRLKTEGLNQEGLGYANSTQKLNLDNLPTSIDLTNQGLKKDLAVKDSSILSDRVRDAYTKAQTGNIGREVAEKGKAREAAAALYAAARNPDFSANGKLDQAKVFDAVVASGVNPMDLYGASAAYDVVSGRNDAKATAALDAAFAKEKEKIDYEQGIKNLAKEREAAIQSSAATLDRDYNLSDLLFDNKDAAKGEAALKSAAAIRFKDANGITRDIPPNIINAAKESAASDGVLSSAATLKAFQDYIDTYVGSEVAKSKAK